MTYVLKVAQPWAHLLLSGQIDVLPGLEGIPPKDACGSRIGVEATRIDSFLAQRLIENFPNLTYPEAKMGERGSVGLWRPSRREKGKWKTLKSNEWNTTRLWVPDARANFSEPYHVKFSLGLLGSIELCGWLGWEYGDKKPSRQYRPPEASQAPMKLHKVAHGPVCMVLRNPSRDAVTGKELSYQ